MFLWPTGHLQNVILKSFFGKTLACIDWRAGYVNDYTFDICKGSWQVSTLSAAVTKMISKVITRLTTSLRLLIYSVWPQ